MYTVSRQSIFENFHCFVKLRSRLVCLGLFFFLAGSGTEGAAHSRLEPADLPWR